MNKKTPAATGGNEIPIDEIQNTGTIRDTKLYVMNPNTHAKYI
jgi:hypothetical protein